MCSQRHVVALLYVSFLQNVNVAVLYVANNNGYLIKVLLYYDFQYPQSQYPNSNLSKYKGIIIHTIVF